MNRDLLLETIEKIADTIIENKEMLNDLDRAIGDADHGINMARGFNEVKAKIDTVREKDCGDILKMVAMTLISTVGGASGPLYGTAFMKAAAVAKGKMELEKQDFVEIYNQAIEGIKMRGKSDKGCKTMLDALIPAQEAFYESIEKGQDLSEASKLAEIAAEKGVEYTKEIIATKGRASYLGERSIGHQDPGATSSYLILKVIAEVLAK